MSKLAGRTVMITGASRGLGAALALAFAGAGARVSLCGRDPDALRAVEEEVRAIGGACLARVVDVRDEDAVAAWVDDTTRELGAPRVLVNNASVLGPRSPLADYPVDQWHATLDINLTGAFLVTRAVLPSMLRYQDGAIINVSSGAAVVPRRDWGAYAVSKHALEGYSLNLAAELQGTGVRVNLVDPGGMRTTMRAAAYPDEDPRGLPEPAAITPVFLWLAGAAGREVTGQRLRAADWRAP